MGEHNTIRFGVCGAAILALTALAGCGEVAVKAAPALPHALITRLPLTVGTYYGEGFRSYVHKEDRWGSGYVIDLGAGHVAFADELFKDEFRDTVPVASLGAIPADAHLAFVVEPRIERYSFLTSRDTGGEYFAVTIDYRLNLFDVKGERIDSLTFVGYGSAPSKGMGSEKPLEVATRNAMRDAAAKFLVQFPEQSTVKKLLAGETVLPLSAQQVANAAAAGPSGDSIDIVPIVEKVHKDGDRPDASPATPLRISQSR